MTYFGPDLDPPRGGSGRKTTTLVRDLEHFIHAKFHQNLSSGSGEEVESLKCLTDDRRRTTDGQRTTPLAPVSYKGKVKQSTESSTVVFDNKEKGRNLTPSHDNSPYTNRKFQNATL